jgi:hypothetical protein
MYVVVQIRKSNAPVSGKLPTDVQEAVSRLGTTLRPMHPGVNDPNLASYYYAETPDQPTAEQVIARLRQCNSVEAAYLKPPEGPP